MEIIKNKQYTKPKTIEFDFVSYNSKGTLSIVTKDGTHYNFHDLASGNRELKKLIDFISQIKKMRS